MTTAVELADVLDQADAATGALASARSVPPAVEAFVEGLADDLHADAPALLDIDPYRARELLAGALQATKALRHEDVTTRRADLRVALEGLRQSLRDTVDATSVGADRPTDEVLRELVAIVAVPQAALARLLGVSTRQMQRWLDDSASAPTGDDEARVRAVAQAARHLRYVFTGPGVLRWFQRPHPALAGQAPEAVLADAADLPRLLRVAASSRAQDGA